MAVWSARRLLHAEPDPVAADKRLLRERIRSHRDALPEPERARASGVITQRLLCLPQWTAAACVMAYGSFGKEFDTTELLRAALAQGKTLVLPRVFGAQRRLCLHRIQDLEQDLVPGVWGIPEPLPGRCPEISREIIELIVVPGLAFSPAGARLGYGGGYYDQLLGHWPGRPFLVAPAFALQVVPSVPTGPHDVPVDLVLSEA